MVNKITQYFDQHNIPYKTFGETVAVTDNPDLPDPDEGVFKVTPSAHEPDKVDVELCVEYLEKTTGHDIGEATKLTVNEVALTRSFLKAQGIEYASATPEDIKDSQELATQFMYGDAGRPEWLNAYDNNKIIGADLSQTSELYENYQGPLDLEYESELADIVFSADSSMETDDLSLNDSFEDLDFQAQDAPSFDDPGLDDL